MKKPKANHVDWEDVAGGPSHAEVFLDYALQMYQQPPTSQELLSHDFELAGRESLRRIAELEKNLAGVSKIQEGLYRLQNAGVCRYKVLDNVVRILASEIHAKEGKRYLLELRRRNRNMRSLAHRMRSMAEETERAYSDPVSYLYMSGPSLQAIPDPHVTPVVSTPKKAIEELRALADDLAIKARDWGDLFRSGGAKDAIKRHPTVVLLRYVQFHTGDARKHLPTLAEMLNCAYKTCGIKKTVTPQSLNLLLARHVIPALAD